MAVTKTVGSVDKSMICAWLQEEREEWEESILEEEEGEEEEEEGEEEGEGEWKGEGEGGEDKDEDEEGKVWQIYRGRWGILRHATIVTLSTNRGSATPSL